MRRSMRQLLLAFALMLASASSALAVALPPALELGEGLRQLGRGEARWWGLRLYEAALWVPGERWSADAPYALALRYARDFSGERLAGTSIDEIERLFGGGENELSRWERELKRALPDVKEGETLVGVFRPGRGVAFYHGDALVFESGDELLARRFFAIWLDPRTRSPELREALLGRAGGEP